MALTISIEGTGVIANSDGITDSAGGSWGEVGGGSISLSTETYKYGSSCVAGAYSNKAGWHYYDRGAGSELDFGTAGTQEGEFIYLWIANPTPGLNETTANNGLRVRIGSSTGDYREFMILASDALNSWDGRWKVFVIDPTKTGSWTDTGTYNTASIRYIGIYIDATALAKGDNIFISQIAVGTGLRITGTSTTGWQDVVDYCTDYPNRAWGMIEQRGDTIYAKGKLYIGDTTQTAVTSFSDSGKNIQFEKSEYWSGSAWVSTVPVGAYGIIIEDNATYTTTFQDGIIVGTDNGRSGSSISGNDNENIYLDLHGGNNASSSTLLYGTTFNKIYGAINFGDNSNHKLYSCSFIQCSQVDPVGAPVIRNCTFAETVDVDSALLWNESINIQNCSFIANTLGAAIEHPSSTGTPYTHSYLTFSGNTFDVLNSSGSAITINNTYSNGSTSEGSAVTFASSISISIHVQDQAAADVAGALVYVDEDNESPYIINTTSDANGDVSGSYSGAASVATVRIRKYGYKPYVGTASLLSDINLNVTLITDPQQT